MSKKTACTLMGRMSILRQIMSTLQDAGCSSLLPHTPADLKDSGGAAGWEPSAVSLLQKLPLAAKGHLAQGHVLFLGHPISNDCPLWGYKGSDYLPQIMTTLKGHPSIKAPHGVSWGFVETTARSNFSFQSFPSLSPGMLIPRTSSNKFPAGWSPSHSLFPRE